MTAMIMQILMRNPLNTDVFFITCAYILERCKGNREWHTNKCKQQQRFAPCLKKHRCQSMRAKLRRTGWVLGLDVLILQHCMLLVCVEHPGYKTAALSNREGKAGNCCSRQNFIKPLHLNTRWWKLAINSGSQQHNTRTRTASSANTEASTKYLIHFTASQ